MQISRKLYKKHIDWGTNQMVIFLSPAIITDKVSIDTVVDLMGRVKAVPADDALRGWEGGR